MISWRLKFSYKKENGQLAANLIGGFGVIYYSCETGQNGGQIIGVDILYFTTPICLFS